MIKINEFWFEFKGIRSTDLHVELTGMPDRPHAASRGEKQPVGGRHGYLWEPDDLTREIYDDIIVRVPCMTRGTFDIDAISAWLSGAGDLRFSDEPERIYHARVAKEFSRSNKMPRFADQAFTPSFDCFPLRYKRLSAVDADDWVPPSNGQTITNSGTVESEPRITIEGTGDIILTIGSQLVTFDSVSGGIIVDSELGDCFTLAMDDLLNNKATFDEFPLLAPGANIVSWTGSVTKVTIRPRVRYL